MTVKELAHLAADVERRTEQLYRDMIPVFRSDGAMVGFLTELAVQEAQHARFVETALQHASHPDRETGVSHDLFTLFFNTIDDVSDEVIERGVDTRGALEIIIHLERSVAEEFYGAMAKHVQGLPNDFAASMRESCITHMHTIESFRAHCLAAL